ncbi:FAD dependent oxidoreductase [Legionella santicrucis]|uniref:FAD dependent oxidoreductase n=1 Tax=Legionella santicrucis TaxID=45074 RepID=A0A0W0Z3I9_9GAMM|nr:FAD-dependent oxidoreductase [Legionella santicrucis]KTD63703.1 FAD dependent oxidoreductase [Legionella santicrucis]
MSALDAIIIGGGFYGSAIAIYLAKQRGFKHIVLVEREDRLLKRASYNNQARVHNGYHYPRSFTTAYRSRVNLPKFVRDWPNAVKQDFTKLYAIARQNSKVTAKQFERFCYEIGAKIQLAKSTYSSLFNPQLIERVFLVEEYAFDTSKLEKWAIQELEEACVTLHFKSRATAIFKGPDKLLNVVVKKENRTEELLTSHYVFNCTYSGLNQFNGDYTGTQTRLKQEITEMALMQMPLELENLGITVMDGPFFSMMPFPALGMHSLSHVRYTPHINWLDQQGVDPYERLNNYEQASRVDRMIRDVSRYLPALFGAKYIDSLFEIKTILVKNESDDGRPILFEKHLNLSGLFSVLGGKIDNIYDVFEKLDMEQFEAIKPLEQVVME